MRKNKLNPSNEYWQARLSDNIFKKNTKLMEQELLKAYKRAGKTIEGQMVDLYAKMLEGGEISANMMFQNNRYKVIQDKINNEIIKLGKKEEQIISKSLLKSYKEVYQVTNKGMGVAAEWTILNEHMAKEVIFSNIKGADFSERIWGNKFALREKLEQVVTDTVIAGRSKDVGVKAIRERFGVGFSDADRIVRTETQRVLNEGQAQSYISNNYTQYEYLAELDDRTSDICEDLNGEVFDFIDKQIGVNFPPMHPNCRSTIIPVLNQDLFK